MKMFIHKILHLMSINNNSELKQSSHEFKYKGDPQTSDAKEIKNETVEL